MKTNKNSKKKYFAVATTTAIVASALAPTALAIESQTKEDKPVVQDSYKNIEEVKLTPQNAKVEKEEKVESVKNNTKAENSITIEPIKHTPDSVKVDKTVPENAYSTVLEGSQLDKVVTILPDVNSVNVNNLDNAKNVNNLDNTKPVDNKALDVVRPPTKEELDARTGLDSNKDDERRKALEDKYGIKLTDDMVWKDKKGQTTVNPDGTVSKYTSHDEMKALGSYAVNANRQELIQYGIKTGDWQPYRAFEAERTPGYFEIVDGKYEYTKAYYGNLLQSHIMDYNSKIGKLDKNSDEWKALVEHHEAFMKENVKKFNEAPGVTPYVPHLNHNEEVAKETGAVMYDKDFFNSKYNHPDFLKGLIK